jgi:hypothetical protein
MKELCMKVHFFNENLSTRPNKYFYDHENKMIESSVNNINQTSYIYNVWSLNKVTWHRQLNYTSRKYLLINRKVENQHLKKKHSSIERFKRFKLIYLN